LMQAILSPQEAADLLFFLISAMSMVNATLQPEPSLTIAEGAGCPLRTRHSRRA
jgi:hypothetical protein